MTAAGDALARAALDLTGTPFRLHGRDPATGLDCVGLVAASFARIGCRFDPPGGYGLRNRSVAHLLDRLENAPARRISQTIPAEEAGDILLCAVGSGQHHLVIRADAGTGSRAAYVHAHAGLRRVVRTPGEPPWPIIAAWRPILR